MSKHPYAADERGNATANAQAILADAFRHGFTNPHLYLDSLEATQDVSVARATLNAAGYAHDDADTRDSKSFGFTGADTTV